MQLFKKAESKGFAFFVLIMVEILGNGKRAESK